MGVLKNRWYELFIVKLTPAALVWTLKSDTIS